MRSQIGKRAKRTDEEQKQVTLSREFVERSLRKSLAIGEEYLLLSDVKTAININAIEQRILTRNKVLQMLTKKIDQEKLKNILEEENHFDRHRITKML